VGAHFTSPHSPPPPIRLLLLTSVPSYPLTSRLAHIPLLSVTKTARDAENSTFHAVFEYEQPIRPVFVTSSCARIESGAAGYRAQAISGVQYQALRSHA
jgi:hypothetical protein